MELGEAMACRGGGSEEGLGQLVGGEHAVVGHQGEDGPVSVGEATGDV